MAKWLLDAGHGGTDPGATYNGRKESNDVLKLTLRVGEILKDNGEAVSYTRTTDKALSLAERSNIDKAGSYDYFVSIHRNAYQPEKAKGVETHIYASCGKREELAKKVNDNLVAVGFTNRGVKISNFHVLRETKSAAILIETGFIDNTSDNNLFDSKFEAIAQAIAKGCLSQIGKSIKVESTSNSTATATRETYYRVIVGSYKDRNNADAQQKKLKENGFDSFLEAFKK